MSFIHCCITEVSRRYILKQQSSEVDLRPIACHSRQLRSYEKNYSITELQCLAIIDAECEYAVM